MTDAVRKVALLLSGGAGTRLWPVSRNELPKQFIKLFGTLSLYQMTLRRLADAGVTDFVVVANRDHQAVLESQAAEIGIAKPYLLLEPMRRDSAAAIAAGASFAVRQFGAQSIVCAMPCDHLIPDTQHFSCALQTAVQIARRGYLATFGIRPTHPSSEFGYLQRGKPLNGIADAFHVLKFHEKPQRALAESYLARGDFDWNSGMFVFQADIFASEADALMPDVWRAVSASLAAAAGEGHCYALEPDAFARAPRISIDYALFERSSKVAMAAAEFAWSDVGNWSAAYEALPHDADGNAVVGDVALRDCTNILAYGDGTRIVAIGMSDVVVVARPDGIFVAPRARAAEIKDFVKT